MRIRQAIALWVAALGLAAVGAFAASGTTSKLEIKLRYSRNDCDAITALSVVMQDRDGVPYAATRDKNDSCHWTLDTTPNSFNTALIHFSLRLFGAAARTGCKEPQWQENEAVAMISIEKPPMPAQQITITPTPEIIKLPYARELSGDDFYAGCVETATLDYSRWKIDQVAFRAETVRLTLFQSTYDLCGMVVNSLRPLKKAAKTNDPHIEVRRDELVDALALQGLGASRCNVPNLSSAAIDISDRNLRKKGLISLTFAVTK